MRLRMSEGECEEYGLIADCLSLQNDYYLCCCCRCLPASIRVSTAAATSTYRFGGSVYFRGWKWTGLCSCSNLGKVRSCLASFPFGTGVEA